MLFTIAMHPRLQATFKAHYEALISRNGVANRFGLPALSFQWGMGDSLYLLEDGQLLIDSMDDPDALPVSIATNEEYWAALVTVARWLDEPSLLEHLPPRPPHIPPCLICEGDHWVNSGGRAISGPRVICPHCGGIGWKQPRRRNAPTD